MRIYKILLMQVVCLALVIQPSVADDIPGNGIPGIEYHEDSGLVLLDPDGLHLVWARVYFRDFTTNSFFDNSPDNPLFAEFGGLIPNWESYHLDRGIWGESTIAEGYSGPPRCWAQISSGLDSEDFRRVLYGWVENPDPGGETNVTIVPGRIGITPTMFDFHYYLGDPNPEPQTLYVWAKGVDTLNWQITEDCNWFDVSPTSGQSFGEVDEVTLAVDISGLGRGSYHCQLTILDPNASEHIRYVPVNLFIGSKLFVPSQYLTIQAAIDAAENFDMVLVADGTYTGPGNRDIRFRDKAITVRSESGPENCIIDCQNSDYGFNFFYDREALKSVLDGFTITNGYPSGIWCHESSPTINNCTITDNFVGDEGGIYCYRSSPTITNCAITNNVGFMGGGIYCQDSSPTITNCIISGNSAGEGGGIFCGYRSNPTITNCTITGNSAETSGGIACMGGNPLITNCTIADNTAEYNGGGINCEWSSSPTITNCTVSGNSAGYNGGGIYNYFGSSTMDNCIIAGNSAGIGGGIYSCQGNRTITNCTFTENSAPNGSALACDSWEQMYPSSVQVTNCILWGSGNEIWNNDGSTITITYSDIQDGYEGEGNIDADPCFVEPGYWADANDPNIIVEPNDPNAIWVESDYYLLPDSPCIDAGDPNYIPEPDETDIDGNPRVINGQIDMGAYETNYIPAAMKLTPQMLNCNSKGKYVKAHLTLPEGFLPEDVDVNEPAVAEPMGAESEYIKVLGAGPVRLEICFNRAAFCDGLTETGEIEITVIGPLTTGRYFYATDTIKIKP